MLALIISSIIISSVPNSPTEVIGSAATPNGGRNEIFIEQPENIQDPFGLPASAEQANSAPSTTFSPEARPASPTPTNNSPQTASNSPTPLVSQTSEVNPKDMNPLDYKNQIENTIYQSGDRLIDVQSIPLQDISSAVQPNLQPEITDYPAF